FPQTIKCGTYKLSVQFSGKLNDLLRGLYRSRCEDGQYMAVTQYEAVDARWGFLCGDEPQRKAWFDIVIIREKGHVALSNGEADYERALYKDECKKLGIEDASELVAVHFTRTPPMSTYLVAMAAGPLVGSEVVLANRTEMQIWTGHGDEHLTSYALRRGAEF